MTFELEEVAVVLLDEGGAQAFIADFKSTSEAIRKRDQVVKMAMVDGVVSAEETGKHPRDFGVASTKRGFISGDGETGVFSEE